MATRDIPFGIDKSDGTGPLIGAAATATVQYGTGVAGAVTVTVSGNGYSLPVDDTQDALVFVTAAGATTFPFTVTKIPSVVASNMRGTDNAMLAANYVAPATPANVTTAQGVITAAITAKAVTPATDISALATEANATANRNTVTTAITNKAVTPATSLVGIALTTDIPTAATIAAAVWGAGTRSLTTFGTLAADAATAVWAAVTRTLTSAGSAGATAAEVWGYATRGLTDKAGFSGTATNMVAAAPSLTPVLDAIAAKPVTPATSLVGVATSANVTAAKDAVIAAIPTGGEALTLEQATHLMAIPTTGGGTVDPAILAASLLPLLEASPKLSHAPTGWVLVTHATAGQTICTDDHANALGGVTIVAYVATDLERYFPVNDTESSSVPGKVGQWGIMLPPTLGVTYDLVFTDPQQTSVTTKVTV